MPSSLRIASPLKGTTSHALIGQARRPRDTDASHARRTRPRTGRRADVVADEQHPRPGRARRNLIDTLVTFDQVDALAAWVKTFGVNVIGIYMKSTPSSPATIVYDQVHMMTGETDAASRLDWIASLDAIHGLDPNAVVAGHKRVHASDSPDDHRTEPAIPTRLLASRGRAAHRPRHSQRHARSPPRPRQPPRSLSLGTDGHRQEAGRRAWTNEPARPARHPATR